MTNVENIPPMGTTASDGCLFQCLTALHVRIDALEAVQTDWRYNVRYLYFRNGIEAPDEREIPYRGRTYGSAEEWWDTVVYRAVLDDCGKSATPRSLSFGAAGLVMSDFRKFRGLPMETRYEFNGYFGRRPGEPPAFRSPLVVNVYVY